MSEQITIKILKFNPLQLELPAAEVLTGTVNILLPEHHYVVKSLPFADLMSELAGVHLGSDAAMWNSVIELGDKELGIGEIVQFIVRAQDKYQELHEAIQRALDDRGPLLK
ncbi:MAG: hypothetical protein R2867_19800 [Caldilineaceae bacterium]